ncbi:c-type cytochrome, partial [Pelomicrobium sp. P1]|uniref:c-type cytochrome n=1 Tax=Pelomicrobium sp. P1 TaxID=3463361 RepID=UPI004055D62D
MKSTLAVLLTVSIGIGAAPTPGLAAEDLQARSWAASCAACHGTEGRAVGGMPALAGKPKEDLYK